MGSERTACQMLPLGDGVFEIVTDSEWHLGALACQLLGNMVSFELDGKQMQTPVYTEAGESFTMLEMGPRRFLAEEEQSVYFWIACAAAVICLLGGFCLGLYFGRRGCQCQSRCSRAQCAPCVNCCQPECCKMPKCDFCPTQLNCLPERMCCWCCYISCPCFFAPTREEQQRLDQERQY